MDNMPVDMIFIPKSTSSFKFRRPLWILCIMINGMAIHECREQSEVTLECPSGGSQAMIAKDSRQRQQPRLQYQSPLSQSDEEDSIFSGLIDDDCLLPPNLVKNHQTRTMKARACAPANNNIKAFKTGTEVDILRSRVASNGTEEDIFSGVSVSSQQQLSSLFPRPNKSNAV